MQTQETMSWVETLSPEEATECLASLQGLAGQLNSAMDAIAQRRLPVLQDRIHEQQMTCERLKNLRYKANGRLMQAFEPESNLADSDLASEIKAATESLLMLNNRYSALLKHSGDTLRLLSGLYRSYRGTSHPTSGVMANLQTWSCEA